MWEWFCYDDGEEDSPWHRWYHERDDAVQGKHDAIFGFLEVSPAHLWRPHTKKINDDIIEVRIHGTVQHRLFGFFGPQREQFTFVIFCTHKQKVYDPPDAKRTAAKRKREIEKGRLNVHLCKRPEKIDFSG
jgi:hypothetical protein